MIDTPLLVLFLSRTRWGRSHGAAFRPLFFSSALEQGPGAALSLYRYGLSLGELIYLYSFNIM